MNVGQELDAKVAEVVMGWIDIHTFGLDNGRLSGYPPGEQKTFPVPHYSTDIAAAWQVVEKLLKDGYEVHFHCLPDGRFHCLIMTDNGEIDAGILLWEARADTAPHAICRAALEMAKESTK